MLQRDAPVRLLMGEELSPWRGRVLSVDGVRRNVRLLMDDGTKMIVPQRLVVAEPQKSKSARL
jgi:hypothetical protein